MFSCFELYTGACFEFPNNLGTSVHGRRAILGKYAAWAVLKWAQSDAIFSANRSTNINCFLHNNRVSVESQYAATNRNKIVTKTTKTQTERQEWKPRRHPEVNLLFNQQCSSSSRARRWHRTRSTLRKHSPRNLSPSWQLCSSFLRFLHSFFRLKFRFFKLKIERLWSHF